MPSTAIISQGTNYSTKDICLAMYDGKMHLHYRSLCTLLKAISVAEKDKPAGIYASAMLAYVTSNVFSVAYMDDVTCLKAILGILITLL